MAGAGPALAAAPAHLAQGSDGLGTLKLVVFPLLSAKHRATKTWTTAELAMFWDISVPTKVGLGRAQLQKSLCRLGLHSPSQVFPQAVIKHTAIIPLLFISAVHSAGSSSIIPP